MMTVRLPVLHYIVKYQRQGLVMISLNMRRGLNTAEVAVISAFCMIASGLFGAVVNVATSEELEAALTSALSTSEATEIVCAAGEYSTTKEWTLNQPITLRGATGDPEDVVISGNGSFRIFKITNTGVVINSLTVENGYATGGANISFDCSAAGGVVTNCIVRNGLSTGSGGGISLNSAGLVTHCIVSNNVAANNGSKGGAVWINKDGATVRNCLIAGNSHNTPCGGKDFGAGVAMQFGLLDSCTVVGNSSAGCAGVGLWSNVGKAKVKNCVIYGNIVTDESLSADKRAQYAVYEVWTSGAKADFERCATSVNINDTCPVITEDPFIDAAAGNYRPKDIPEIVDNGIFGDWMAGSVDLDGNNRIINRIPDVGAYEKESSLPSASFFVQGADMGFFPFDVTFSAATSNLGNSEDITYKWDFGDGTAAVEKRGDAFVTHTFNEFGVFQVSLTVENAETGLSYVVPDTIPISTIPKAVYLSKSGSNIVPYDTEATAAHDFSDVWNLTISDSEIVVLEGEYDLTSEYVIDKPMTIRGHSANPENVVLRGNGNSRIFSIKSPDVIVSSLTVTNGACMSGNGGNIYIDGKSTGGTIITNCVITGGKALAGGKSGGGIYIGGSATVTHCIIRGNVAANDGSNGGAVYLCNADAVVRNCLITENSHSSTKKSTGEAMYFGAGVAIQVGKLYNCTVTGNRGAGCAGVATWASANAASVVNCLIAGNIVTDETLAEDQRAKWEVYAIWPNGKEGAPEFNHCAATVHINDSCTIVSDPFVDAASGNYRPKRLSAIEDRGVLQSWMEGAGDLDGNPRIINEIPDIGAYEITTDNSPRAVFIADGPVEGFAPHEVSFTVNTFNFGDAADITYKWNFGDGTEVLEKRGEAAVTHTFSEFGDYQVSLTVENSETGASYTVPERVPVSICPKVTYLSKSGSNTPPYATPETAAHDFADLYRAALDGSEIVAANGVYEVPSEYALYKTLTVRGLTGRPEDVVFCGDGDNRIFKLSAANIVLSGLTVTNGVCTGFNASGGNIQIEAVAMGAIVTNCIITGGKAVNISGASGGCGGGGISVLADNALVTHSVILGNSSANNGAWGGAVWINNPGAVVRNCLITGNSHSTAYSNDGKYFGAGVAIYKGKLESCTVVGNISGGCAGVGLWANQRDARITNCLIADNIVTNNDVSAEQKEIWEVYEVYRADSVNTDFINCAAPVLINETENCVFLEENPFVNPAAGNYRLNSGTKALDSGLLQNWMINSVDLDSRRRARNGTPDIGCYERPKYGTVIMVK